MHMEICANPKCHPKRPFQVGRGTSVTIDGKCYCKPSCANEARGCPSYKPPAKEKGNAETSRPVPRSATRFEHG